MPPQSTVAGFVYTRRDPGTKVVSVSLLGDERMEVFDFILFSPDLAADHRRIDLHSLYAPGEVREVDEAALREALERLPCCPTNDDGSRPGVNAGGDPYVTDGLRGVLFIASEPVPITEIEWLDWRDEPTPEERAALLGE